MKKHVWILNHYAGHMFFDKGGRHYNFAKYLRRAGYEPVVLCCNAKHGQQEYFFETDALWHEHMAEEIETPFVFVKGRTYTGNGKQRILNMVDFYRNVQKAAKEYAKQHGKPDVIYASSVHPLTLVAGIRLAKHFGVECICEVRDLWPESIVEYSSRFKKRNPLIRLLYQGEKWIYKKADKLIFTMAGGGNYIADQGWDTAHGGPIDLQKVHHINNGVDLEVFDDNKEHYQIKDPDLEDPSLFTICFAGTLVRSNHIDGLLDLAKRFQEQKDIRFLIWGSGEATEKMLHRIREEDISNVHYKGTVEKRYIPYIVSHCSLNLMHAAETTLYRYGASPNKLFDYFAAGKPIIQDFTYYGDLVKRYGCGEVCEWDLDRVADAVERLYCLSEEARAGIQSNCWRAAQDYNFKKLTEKLVQTIEEQI